MKEMLEQYHHARESIINSFDTSGLFLHCDIWDRTDAYWIASHGILYFYNSKERVIPGLNYGEYLIDESVGMRESGPFSMCMILLNDNQDTIVILDSKKRVN